MGGEKEEEEEEQKEAEVERSSIQWSAHLAGHARQVWVLKALEGQSARTVKKSPAAIPESRLP